MAQGPEIDSSEPPAPKSQRTLFGGSWRRLLDLVRLPWLDLMGGLDRCLAGGWRALLLVMLGLLMGWWLYVPVHELLHAAGCMLSGGEVSRLEIAYLYGGGILERLIPFVAAGSDYAGQLTGFDTGNNDGVYLATVLAPFVLTLWPGVWLLRRAGSKGRPMLYGASLPYALAPFLSLTGDAYEMGSILVTRLPVWADQVSLELLRGDDVFLIAEGLQQAGGSPVLWLGWGLALLQGIAWAFLCYGAGAWLATRLQSRSRQAAKTAV